MSRRDSKSANDEEEFVESFDEEPLLGEPEAEFAPDEETVESETAEDEQVEEEGEGDEDEAPKKKRGVVMRKPRANVYTVMMIVSFVALIIGSVCLYAEVKPYASDMHARTAR